MMLSTENEWNEVDSWIHLKYSLSECEKKSANYKERAAINNHSRSLNLKAFQLII